LRAGKSHRRTAAFGERDCFNFNSPTRFEKKCAKSGKPALEYCVTAARIEKPE
jgi:hypothetical protein